ncbi:MAG: dockerin type I domain-containing protein [Ruminococcus flavefaciens]|nr:dockerin type I domain-containing protein [Ruminococcus flavefaciens]MCM1231058.1 dockerin type I domain-containing protein [Ruminococcus flavefaciens]
MNDIDRIIRKIMLDDTFKPLRERYIVDLKQRDENYALFELLTSNFKPNKHYFMRAEILQAVESINDESAEILDYKILKINQRIRLNSDLTLNTDSMVRYISDAYSVRLLAMRDEQRTIYYLLYTYEPLDSLAELTASRKLSYSTEDAVKNALIICIAVKQCHKVGIFHNDIVPENIFVSQNGEYKLGKIDMKNFVNYIDPNHPSRDSSITNEPSVQNDIYMLGRLIGFMADNASRKNQLLNSRLRKIAEKSRRKKGGYRSVDEIIGDLQKPSAKYFKLAIPVTAVLTIALAGAGIFAFAHFSGKDVLGDVNGDGVINQSDVAELQSIYSALAVSKKELTEKEKSVCDINADGYVDVRDTAILIDYISYRQSENVDITVQEFMEILRSK